MSLHAANDLSLFYNILCNKQTICIWYSNVKLVIYIPANMGRWASVGLLLGQRRRRWANSKPTLGQRLLFAGNISIRSTKQPFFNMQQINFFFEKLCNRNKKQQRNSICHTDSNFQETFFWVCVSSIIKVNSYIGSTCSMLGQWRRKALNQRWSECVFMWCPWLDYFSWHEMLLTNADQMLSRRLRYRPNNNPIMDQRPQFSGKHPVTRVIDRILV